MSDPTSLVGLALWKPARWFAGGALITGAAAPIIFAGISVAVASLGGTSP